MGEAAGPAWVDLSSPAPGRPFLPLVENLAGHVRHAVAAAAAQIQVDQQGFAHEWAPRVGGVGFQAPRTGGELRARAAGCVVAEWLTLLATGQHDGTASLSDTREVWSQGRPAVGLLNVPDRGQVFPEGKIPDRETAAALLPYLLDLAVPATRRDVIGGRAESGDRHARKTAGVYYTPGDVASHMVGLVARTDSPRRWLDPASGSGVFLRAVAVERPHDTVYGVDLDPAAAEMASFVLTAARSHPHGPWFAWHTHRTRLVTGDTLACQAGPAGSLHQGRAEALAALASGQPAGPQPGTGALGLTGPWRLGEALPELADGADVVIQNPPYVSARACTTPGSAGAALWGAGAAGNAFTLFVEQGVRLGRPDAELVAVVPASIVTSRVASVRRCREVLYRAAGAVTVASFDRAPDGLFGDDIKTRCSVLHLDRAAPPTLHIGPLRRITSANRREALAAPPPPAVPVRALLSATPPKIDTENDLALVRAIEAASHSLAQLVTESHKSVLALVPTGPRVALGPTAYNWLNVQRSPTRGVSLGHDSASPFHVLTCADDETADAVYAVLSSRLALWAWRTYGDGFHVGADLLPRLPAPAATDHEGIARLGKLGAELWRSAVEGPVVSRNGGRTTVAFPTAGPPGGLLDEIDRFVLHAVGMSDPAVTLATWHHELVAAGRVTRPRTSTRSTE